MAFKVLRLTHSGQTNSSAPPEQRADVILRQMLMEATGEEVTIVSKVIWPAPELPGIVERWMEREQPDVVHIRVNQFWYAFASAPLKLERMFGSRVGQGLARSGRKASSKPWLAGSRPFKLARRAALKTIGGAYYFEVEEVEHTVQELVRVVLRHEGAVPVVHAPARLTEETPDGIAPGWSDERRRELNRCLRAMFAELGVIGRANEERERATVPEHKTLIDRDGHPNARGQVSVASSEFGLILAGWQQLRGVEAGQAGDVGRNR
jgi:hypothetical protein